MTCYGAMTRVLECDFRDNLAGLGGGLEVYLPGQGQASITGCDFETNVGNSGGAMFFQEVECTVTDCSSIRNRGCFGGAVFCHEASPVFLRCVSYADTADRGSAMHCQTNCDPRLVSCTFSHGYGTYDGSLVHVTDNSNPVLENCILAFCANGKAVDCTSEDSAPTFRCSDIYANEWGDWTDTIADQLGVEGNISVDPLFCDPDAGDLRLQPASPCSGDSSGCGRMGALPVGCARAAPADTGPRTPRRMPM